MQSGPILSGRLEIRWLSFVSSLPASIQVVLSTLVYFYVDRTLERLPLCFYSVFATVTNGLVPQDLCRRYTCFILHSLPSVYYYLFLSSLRLSSLALPMSLWRSQMRRLLRTPACSCPHKTRRPHPQACPPSLRRPASMAPSAAAAPSIPRPALLPVLTPPHHPRCVSPRLKLR